MNKARRAIVEAMPTTDVLIEVLDARMPGASSNPVLAEIGKGKPCLKVLSKSDLADPKITKDWIRYFESEPSIRRVRVLALTTTRPSEARARVAESCKGLAPHLTGPFKHVRAMVVGIPFFVVSTSAPPAIRTGFVIRTVPSTRLRSGVVKTSSVGRLTTGTGPQVVGKTAARPSTVW